MSSCCSARQDFDDEINIVLLGKTGNGKSSSGNTILSRDVFPVSDSPSSVTKLATLECSQSEITSSIINVVDTPGLMDTDGDDSLSVIGQGMSLCPSGFNAVIIVLRYGTTFTKEEEECIKLLKQYLGPTFLQDFGIIIMTRGDCFKSRNKNLSFSDWCRVENHKDMFGQLLAECNGRCALFYNRGNDYEEYRKKCVAELLDIITTQIPKRYRCDNFDSAIATRKIILDKLGMPVLHKQIQEQISFLDQLLQKNIKTDSFTFDDMTNRSRELHKAIDDLPETPELKTLKLQIKLITDKIDDLKAEKDKQRRRDIQKQMKKDLRTIKNPPSKSPVVIANIKLIFAKVAYPVGMVCTVGQAADFLRNLVFDKKIEYEVEVKMYEKRKKRFDEALERVQSQMTSTTL